MKTYTIISDINFIVNEKKGVVICKGKVDINTDKILYYLLNNLSFNNNKFYWGCKSPTVVGKAKCIMNIDSFDLEKGKRIAEARMRIKAYKKAIKVWEGLEKEISKDLETIKEISCGNINAINTEIQYINSKIK